MKKTFALAAAVGLTSTAAFGVVIPEVEPNDSLGQAQALGAVGNGDSVSADHVVGGVLTDDWFTVTLPDLGGGGSWTIETLPDFSVGDGIADTRLFLWNAAGTSIITSNDDGGLLDPDTGFGLSLITGVAPGTYVIENNGFVDDDVDVNYFLSFTYIPVPGALALLGVAGLTGTRRRRG